MAASSGGGGGGGGSDSDADWDISMEGAAAPRPRRMRSRKKQSPPLTVSRSSAYEVSTSCGFDEKPRRPPTDWHSRHAGYALLLSTYLNLRRGDERNAKRRAPCTQSVSLASGREL